MPNDPRPPSISSGLRIGTPAITTRGFKEADVQQLADWIADVLDKMGDAADPRARAQRGGGALPPLPRLRLSIDARSDALPVLRPLGD